MPFYAQPPIPAPDYMWVPGYWAWNNIDYYWVPGTWIEPPEPGLLWTPGYWGFENGIYVFHAGYWGQHVGFYGGIAYGYGYEGSGFQGGYWESGRFFYNRAITNLGTLIIANVFEKAVVNDHGANRASFNGGAGGVMARATPAELAAEREPHVKPTSLQTEHLRAASTNGALFTSTNHGRPAIAATARPADFKGPGVIPAQSTPPRATPAEEREPSETKPEPHSGNKAGEEKPGERPAAEEKKGPAEKPAAKPAATPEKKEFEERKPPEKKAIEERKPEARPPAPAVHPEPQHAPPKPEARPPAPAVHAEPPKPQPKPAPEKPKEKE
jgi:hypothetical protein